MTLNPARAKALEALQAGIDAGNLEEKDLFYYVLGYLGVSYPEIADKLDRARAHQLAQMSIDSP